MPKESRTDSWNALAAAMSDFSDKYNSISVDAAYNAFLRSGGANLLTGMEEMQNRRVKRYNTMPCDYSKDDIAKMVSDPWFNEKPLRQVSASLASSSRTYDLILQSFPDMMSYNWMITPAYQHNPVDKKTFMRDYHLAHKIVEDMNIKAKAHEIVGLCMQYGKVFYTPRISVDKAHGNVTYAFLQQLPEDWCKIVGYNNGPGKYTVAFNMMYFMTEMCAAPSQFGDLFEPYIESFSRVVSSKGDKYAYSSSKSPKIDVERFNRYKTSETIGSPMWERIGGQYYYWIQLPADRVVTFEIVDRNANVVPPMTGMMVSMTQIPNFEEAQLEICLNPLVSVMTGTIETNDPKGVPNADPLRVSPTIRKMFESLWYQMLDKNNTSGIGLYLAPAKDLKLQTLSDSVSNTNIATTAISDQILKAGLASVIPTTNDPKVGVAELSAQINAKYAEPIYRTMDCFFNNLFKKLFKSPMKFHMFGDIFSRSKELEEAQAGMTLGILPMSIKYAAMQGYSLLDDIAISQLVNESGILDLRKPLSSTYGAQQETDDSSDQEMTPEEKKIINPGGRPEEDGSQNGQKTAKHKF